LGRRSEAEPGERAAGRTLCLTVVEPGVDTCRGQIDVHHLDWDQGCAELGIWLAPQFRGRGLAPQALRLAAAWLFEGCGLRRLTVRTEPDNRPMIGAARAAGFREEEPRQGSACLSLTPGDL
jgi:RimJ/RimL family protein N-acetyltransferase